MSLVQAKTKKQTSNEFSPFVFHPVFVWVISSSQWQVSYPKQLPILQIFSLKENPTWSCTILRVVQGSN